ncbi:MAG: hypothetical protein M1839_009433 [Geoglossum umbratile]|nr:MAG: hypothetical protein M1839_009433 [Geoglossum umbratile]
MPSRAVSMTQLRQSLSQFQLPIQNFQTNDDYNQSVEEFRDREYPMLEGKTYLDHAGTTLYARSLIEMFSDDLISNLYGNPHSASTPAELSSSRIEKVRERTLRFFKADPEEFDLVFVANATAGIKLVTECFRDLEAAPGIDDEGADSKGRSPKADGFWFGYHRDSHTSVIGVRELTDNHHRCFRNDAEVEKWLTDAADGGAGDAVATGEGRLGLFAYPGQSNMTGRRLPLSWPGRLRRSPHPAHRNTYSLLDAAALASTTPIDLSDADAAPDFTVLSFYKMFGFPDLGALIIRRESGHILQWRKYFGGGTVEMVVCIKDAWHSKKTASMHDQLEDGTLPFHNIAALGMAMEVHKRLFGSMESISRHTAHLGKKMYDGLSALQHANGRPVCRIYKEDNCSYSDYKTQGATVAFNIQNAKGELVVYSEVERLADARDIYLRAGGLCNPGGVATYLGFAPWQMKRSFSAGHRCGNEAEGTEIVSGQPTGMVRVSMGAMSTMADVTAFIDFVGEIFVEKQQLGTPLFHVTPVLRKPKTPQYQIECLRVYPIKGCGGYNIPAGVPWEVGARGLYLDREWCIVHLDTGTALSRKRYPKMAKIRPSIDLERGVLVISAPHNEQPELKISLSWLSHEGGDGSRNHGRTSMGNSNFRASASKVCGEPIPAHPHTSPHIIEFFSAAVGARCTLARFSASNTSTNKGLEPRHTKAYLRRSYSSSAVSELSSNKATNRAPTGVSRTSSTTAVDAPQVVNRPVLLPSESPVSVITRTSLEWHNQQVKSTRARVAQPELFRANIVLSEMQPPESRGRKGPAAVSEANIEDNWAFVRIGSLSFELLGPCSRCHLTCADQVTAEKDHELFPVLARTRRFDGEVFFDQDPARVILRRDNPNGKKLTISVGDPVRTWLSSEVYEKPSGGTMLEEGSGALGSFGNSGTENSIHLNHRYSTSSIHRHMENSIILNHRSSTASIHRKSSQSPIPISTNGVLNHRTSTTSIQRNHARSPSHPSHPSQPNATNPVTLNSAAMSPAVTDLTPITTTTAGSFKPSPPAAAVTTPPAADVDQIEFAPLKSIPYGRSSPKPPPPTRSLTGRPQRNTYGGPTSIIATNVTGGAASGVTSNTSPAAVGRPQSPMLMGVAEAERRINELTSTSRSSSEGSSASGKWRHKIAESVVSMLDRPVSAVNH